jgi:hypothetical protein
MNLVSQAEFARRKGVSRKSVSDWKKEGRIVMVDGKVDISASQERLLRTSRRRSKGRRSAVTSATVNGVKVTPSALTGNNPPAIWHKLAPICGEHLEGQDYGALTAAQRMAEAVPTVLAITAEAVGLTASQAKQLQEQFRVSLMETAGLLLDTMDVPPPLGVSSWCDAPMWDPSRFVAAAGQAG